MREARWPRAGWRVFSAWRVASLPLRQPPLGVAIGWGGKVLVDDLLVFRIPLVAPALLEGGAGVVHQLLGRGVVLGAEGVEGLHYLGDGGGEFEVVAVR